MAVVGRFRDLPGAEVASATLEAAGIENYLADACTIGVVWSYSTALGGIRVLVGDQDADAASALLETTAEVEWPAGAFEASTDGCPVCGSGDVAIDSGPRKTLVAMLLTIVPLWLWRSRLRCRNCGWSQVVPLRFRPELLISWLVVGIGVSVVTATICLMLGYAMYGRRA